jgi:tetratricopeptide (TPR) repeat protein
MFMRKRLSSLIFLVLTVPVQALATPQCDGALVDSSLPDTERVEKLANRAFACLKAGKPIQSIALFSELIGVDPNHAQAYLNRGSTFVRMQEFDAGLSDYSRVIELEPNRFEGWYNRGSARVVARRYDEAIADLTEAIRLKPDFGYNYCNRGLSYLRKAEPKKALADFEKGLTLRVDMPLCYYGRGEIELSDGRYQKAIEDLTRGINFKPTAEALAHRATAYERLGESSRALRDYQSALSLQPNSKAAQAGVARLSQNAN